MGLFRNLTFSLRTTLVSAVITASALAIALTVGVIGIPAYNKTKASVRALWADLAKQVSLTATEQILSYFQTAPVTLQIIEGLVEEEELNVSNLEMILDICYRALKANPQFVTVYFTKPDGSLYGVLKIGDEFVGNLRTLGSDGKTLIRNYKIGPGMRWVKASEETSDYDPRKRPFWTLGMKNPKGAWTEPYLFATTNATGFTYVLAQEGKAGIQGIWAVDFQIDYLSKYLESLNVGKEGLVYLISNSGKKIAASTPLGGEIENQPEAVREAWRQFTQSQRESALINVKHRIFYANRFPEKSQIPWNLVTVIHEDDFLQPIQNNALQSLAIGFIPCLLFLGIIAIFFGNLSNRMKKIAKEMDEAGNLSIGTKKEGPPPYSRIREINMMIQSLHKMKIGLCSFSKYVPLDLVKKLIQSGQSAELGGEKKEISVLFADLTQFTTLSELYSTDEIGKILAEFFDTSTREVQKEKGIVDKFMGDAVMALWGAPDRVPDHAINACRAALAMQKIAATNVHIKHKIGINTGLAMVGNFGSVDRMDYTAIGDMVNIAARLEKMNKLYKTQILIGPATAKAVDHELLVRPIDWVVLQGRAHSTLIYELIDKKENATDAIIKAIHTYKQALDAYRTRRFTDAIPLFEKANVLFGGSDTPSKILIKRCISFEHKEPPANWDGVAITD
jgi:adenylate cyclase